MGRTGFVLGIVLAAAVAVVGYRMGSVGGLGVMAIGALLASYVVHATAWRIPTISDVHDRAREDGLGVPRDLRSFDPDIVQDQRLWGSLERDLPGSLPDDPGRPARGR